MIKIVALSTVYLCCWIATVITALVAITTRRARRRPCGTCSH